MVRARILLACAVLAVLSLAGYLVAHSQAQTGGASAQPGTQAAGAAGDQAAISDLTVLSRDGQRTLPMATVNGRQMVALTDLSTIFSLTVREDTAAGGIIVAREGKSVVLSTTQGLASAGGQLVSLPTAPLKRGNAWFVPVEFIGRALSLVYDTRLELRRDSRLVIVGNLRVPRVVVSSTEEPGGARVTIDVSPRVGFKVEQLSGRLLVRFEADRLDAAIDVRPVPGLLTAVAVAEPLNAIGMDLGPQFASFRSAEQQPEGGAPLRIAVDLVREGASAVPGITQSAPPVIEPPPVIFDQPTVRLRTVVLDPGHGGSEEGAKGPGGTLEKDIVLGVARHLKSMLEGRLGLRVLLTRDGDETVTLDQRAAFANNNKADLFISLHANASVRASVAGAEVFYLSLDEYGPEGRRLAEAEGSALAALGGGTRDIELILWDMAQMQHLDASAHLASLVERHLRERVPMSARAIQQAPFRVLVGANMPAVLVEMGFITNPDEEKKLSSSTHQLAIAQALYSSIVDFRGYLDRGPAGAAAPPTAGTAQAPQGAPR